jgi:hypothetical protein
MRRVEAFALQVYRYLSETETDDAGDSDHGGAGEHDSGFGVHIYYEDLYFSLLFLTCVYVSGQIASRFLKMPNLVGEIVCGILLGPPLVDKVPYAEAWVLLGELGYVFQRDLWRSYFFYKM